MLRLGAAGPETQPYSLPWFMGYRVHRGDSLLVVAMMHNPTPKGYQGVRVRVHLTMGPAWLRSLAIQPVYLDVMPPAGIHAYDLPPGRSTKSWEGRPAVAARLLAAGTHLHQYGTGLRLEDVSTRTVLWEVRPNVDAKGEVVSMPRRYFLPFGVPLVPDHLYRLTAEYDNPTGKVLEGGGMGALGGIVIPASGAHGRPRSAPTRSTGTMSRWSPAATCITTIDRSNRRLRTRPPPASLSRRARWGPKPYAVRVHHAVAAGDLRQVIEQREEDLVEPEHPHPRIGRREHRHAAGEAERAERRGACSPGRTPGPSSFSAQASRA